MKTNISNKSVILAGTALAGTAIAGLFAGTAMAQSTGSQAVEVIIKGGPRSTGGVGVQTNQAKDQSIVNKDYIAKQIGSENFAQAINLVPGVSYTSEDPTGLSSGDFRMHGFDGAHVSITIDGTPINDTGNYAIFPGEYAVAESIDHITVNMGQTEVDSPTASAIGGTVNIITKVPEATPSIEVNPSLGSYDYERLYAGLNTGAIGPTGLRGYVSVNDTSADKWRGEGQLKRWGSDGKLYQPLDNGGFLSVGYTWASERNDFYFDGSTSQEQQFGYDFDYNLGWAPPTAVAGQADSTKASNAGSSFTTAPGQAGNDSNFWGLHPNPVDFGDIRGQSKFNFGDKATLTVDPYFFFTLANGGGATYISECDARLVGSTAGTNGTCGTGKGNGVDLNHDGDVLDSVLLYSPSNTETHRYGVNSSFIYRFTDSQVIQATYTLDYGRHRQTGDFTTIDPTTGMPQNVFGSKPGYGTPILAADGTQLENRNRFSIAKLNQFSLNYLGRFMDDKLHVNVGIRDPHFERDLNQYCYTFNGATAYCDSVSTAAVAAALAKDDTGTHAPNATATNLSNLLGTTVKYGANNLANFRMPFAQTYKFTQMLPNVGASYNFNENNQIYATASEGYSAPKTDDLYVSSTELVKPETTDNIGGGYRFKNAAFLASVNLWGSDWKNHIVQSFDPVDPTLSIDRNVGEVKLYGLDTEAGWTVTPHVNLYASAALEHSALQNNYTVTYGSGPDKGLVATMPVKGKELVLTPDQTLSGRATYHNDMFSVSLEAKYQSKRYVSDTNDSSLKANTVANLDAEYFLPYLGKGGMIQLNITNLFNSKYYVRSTTVGTVNDVVFANGDHIFGSSNFLYTASPIQAVVQLKTKF